MNDILKGILGILFLIFMVMINEVSGKGVDAGMAISFMVVAFICLIIGMSKKGD